VHDVGPAMVAWFVPTYLAARMPNILVVEDDDAIRGLVTELLRDDGYYVQEATNGAEALDQVEAGRPDLIVLDLMMPIMDGWAFVQECRQREWCGEVPIVVTSASHDLPRTADQLRAFGVRTCLAKPFDVEGLLALVERYVPSEVGPT
jgi:two-component system, chemotaxis family, chemotaxis protein CheY